MAPRNVSFCALVAALLAISSGAAAARPGPSSSSPSSSSSSSSSAADALLPTPQSCSRQCGAAVAACRAARPQQQQKQQQKEQQQSSDAAAAKAIAQAYGCRLDAPSSSASSDDPLHARRRCDDLSLLLMDLFAYERSGYNRDGVKPDRVVAWADGAAKKVPCAACAGERDACQSLSEVCAPFCLNNRRPQSEWQVVGGASPDLGGRLSELPRLAGSEILFNKPVLSTVSADTRQLGVSASYVAYTSRPAGSRASVHFHTSAVVSCVIAGCNRITLAEAGSGENNQSKAAEPATFCARADGTPTCYLMPAFVKLLNENVGPGEVRMLDVFSMKPDESYFHALEPLGAAETRQGAGQPGGVEVGGMAAAAVASAGKKGN